MRLPQVFLITFSALVLGMFINTVAYAATQGADDSLSVNVTQIPEQAEEALENSDTTEIITLVIKGKDEFELTQDEMELLARIVHAEAGNQDQIGKRLVVDVVLNRMEDSSFPNTISGVIYQSGQFTRPSGFYTESDMNAVILECERRIDTQVLWFRTGSYHSYGTPICQHGAHYFSGR